MAGRAFWPAAALLGELMSLFSFTFGLFLAVVAVAYFLVPARYQWVLLLAASYLFYLCSGWQGLVYLLVTT